MRAAAFDKGAENLSLDVILKPSQMPRYFIFCSNGVFDQMEGGGDLVGVICMIKLFRWLTSRLVAEPNSSMMS